MNPLPSMLLQLKLEFNRLNDEINGQLNNLQSIENEQKQTLNDINKREVELADLVKELNVKLSNKDGLAKRNGVVRDKFNTLDVELQEDAENVAEEKKLFLQHLGIRMHIKEVTSSVWEIKVTFYYMTLVLFYLNFIIYSRFISLTLVIPK